MGPRSLELSPMTEGSQYAGSHNHWPTPVVLQNSSQLQFAAVVSINYPRASVVKIK